MTRPKSLLSKDQHLIFLKTTKKFLNKFYFSPWELNFNTSTLKGEDTILLLSGLNQLLKANSKFLKAAYNGTEDA